MHIFKLGCLVHVHAGLGRCGASRTLENADVEAGNDSCWACGDQLADHWDQQTAVASIALIKLTHALVGLRSDDQTQREGLDSAEHAERGYTI